MKTQKSKTKVILTIKNGYNTNRNVSILKACINHNENNCGLPKKVSVNILIKKNEKFIKTITYKEFLAHLIHQPIAVKVNKSTNNRQLGFRDMNITGTSNAILPQITINGLSRFDDEKDKWNPKTWNIADSHEEIVADHKIFIEIALKPNQEFKIEFEWIETISLNTLGDNHNLKIKPQLFDFK